MKKSALLSAVGLLTVALTSAYAQNSSYVGTWKLDTAQSDFGSQPRPKSSTLVITKDTPDMLAWHLREVDAQGKIHTESWSGPQDGSMHPLKSPDMKAQMGFKREGDGVVIQEKTDNGMTMESHVTPSDDKKTMTEEMTGKDKDGKDIKQKMVWHKTSGAKAGAKSEATKSPS
jgi:hypothetical protein